MTTQPLDGCPCMYCVEWRRRQHKRFVDLPPEQREKVLDRYVFINDVWRATMREGLLGARYALYGYITGTRELKESPGD